MTGSEVKIYLTLHLLANPFTGEIRLPLNNICEKSGINRSTVSRILRSLSESGRHTRFITYKPAQNQWGITQISILKYKKSAVAKIDLAPRSAVAKIDLAPTTAQGSDQPKGDPLYSFILKPFSEESKKSANLLSSLIKNRDPKAKTNPDRWAEDIDKLNRIDKRDWREIDEVIRWCQQDSFWKTNIRSGSKLRAKFDELLDKMNAGGGKSERSYL